MRILMLQTRHGTEDGHWVRCYYRGHIYRVSLFLGRQFVADRMAIELPKKSTFSASMQHGLTRLRPKRMHHPLKQRGVL